MRVFVTFCTLWLSCLALADASDFNKMVGYFGSWSNYRTGLGAFEISDIDPTMFTHLMYAFVGITPDGDVQVLDEYRDLSTDGGLGGFAEFNALRDQNAELKTLVSIGGWNQGALNFSTVVSNSTLRSTFVKNALEFVLNYNFSGLDVAWEYPAQRGGADTDVENFVLLLEELRECFDEEDLLLTVAAGASQRTVDSSYNVSGISAAVDMITLMEYDFHGPWNNFTGPNAPLYVGTWETTDYEQIFNINASVHYWLEQGASAEKLLLGTAFYGRTFTLANSSETTPGSPATGVGEAGTYTQESGVLSYYEILGKYSEENWTIVFDDNQQVPYSYQGLQWISHDNPRSLDVKAVYAEAMGLGGCSIWAIDFDDFRGLYGEKYPLLNTLYARMNGTSTNTTSSSTNSSTISW
ncbi:acidic mammalian chitinase-like isoform X2 [Neodiprion lecontei]|uniref:Acidic mammalian chitinase-like isoform X2 n=1 Tax=Neodiprion lecontei TaxID=441921 RepID=A0ABM3GDI8_NEOLC|nr:acidic mammalian chitinase-like isoform X2 [Neodiprion lecontei]